MCGIAGFFARESLPDLNIIEALVENTELRGTDGFGIWIGRKNKFSKLVTPNKYSQDKKTILEFIRDNLKLNDLLLAISRAAPETEEKSTIDNMQPIINSDCVLVHNGAVTYTIYKQILDSGKFKFNTSIDSEAIIGSYILHDKNIKNAMEYISGGVAAALYDIKLDRLFIINDFKPIAHSYIRGVGYFISSDDKILRQIIRNVIGCPRDGMNMWEDWYCHYLTGNIIRSIDLDSGFMREIPYSPRYIIGDQWDSNAEIQKERVNGR
jgi:asparagine synthetase B (glutamine-hydrolysing)